MARPISPPKIPPLPCPTDSTGMNHLVLETRGHSSTPAGLTQGRTHRGQKDTALMEQAQRDRPSQ